MFVYKNTIPSQVSLSITIVKMFTVKLLFSLIAEIHELSPDVPICFPFYTFQFTKKGGKKTHLFRKYCEE